MENQESELTGLLEMAVSEGEEELLQEIFDGVAGLTKEVNKLELSTMLNGEYDRFNSYLTIHPGAGGTESQDWAEMLLRMYVRWAERKGFKVEFLDYQPGDEAGVKSVTLQISGENAYGYLRSEKGVHRLVRISPFAVHYRLNITGLRFGPMILNHGIRAKNIRTDLVTPGDLRILPFYLGEFGFMFLPVSLK